MKHLIQSTISELTAKQEELKKLLVTQPFSLLANAKELVTVNAKVDLLNSVSNYDKANLIKLKDKLTKKLIFNSLQEQATIETKAGIEVIIELLSEY